MTTLFPVNKCLLAFSPFPYSSVLTQSLPLFASRIHNAFKIQPFLLCERQATPWLVTQWTTYCLVTHAISKTALMTGTLCWISDPDHPSSFLAQFSLPCVTIPCPSFLRYFFILYSSFTLNIFLIRPSLPHFSPRTFVRFSNHTFLFCISE